MKKTKTIDLTKGIEVAIDEETSVFRPTWYNVILMTAYDEGRTFVLTWDGRQLLVRRSLREVLSQFAQDNDVGECERQAIYNLVGTHKGRGYVAGHHRLVPTHGTTNERVIYYMAHRLLEDWSIKDDQIVVASFRGRKRIFRIYIDTSIKTFEGILRAANQVAEYQLDGLDWLTYNYGIKEVDERESVRYHHQLREDCRQAYHQMRQAWVLTVVEQVLRDYLPEEDCQEIMNRIKRNIKK